MQKTVFDFADDGIRWIGIDHGTDGVWLYRQFGPSAQPVSQRKLEPQEVEEYQKMAGNYVRA